MKPVIGLAGGIGAGKSLVARLLGELGAGIIDSDSIGRHEINDPDVRCVLTEWWGPKILDPDGNVDRRKVSAVVFSDPSQRKRLEGLLHPRIARKRNERIAEFRARDDVRMIVLDSPLLYEADLDLMCDAVIFVDASPAARGERVRTSRQWPPGELARREKSQKPLDTKRDRADYVCINDASPAALREQVIGIFNRIMSKTGAV